MSGASKDGREWGRWRYRHATLTLGLSEGGKVIYEVDLDQCGDSAQILDWVLQVSGKAGVAPRDIGDLVHALDDLGGDLQGKVCPWGKNQEFDFGSFLRS